MYPWTLVVVLATVVHGVKSNLHIITWYQYQHLVTSYSTLMVSRGCPVHTRATPLTPPAVKLLIREVRDFILRHLYGTLATAYTVLRWPERYTAIPSSTRNNKRLRNNYHHVTLIVVYLPVGFRIWWIDCLLHMPLYWNRNYPCVFSYIQP